MNDTNPYASPQSVVEAPTAIPPRAPATLQIPAMALLVLSAGSTLAIPSGIGLLVFGIFNHFRFDERLEVASAITGGIGFILHGTAAVVITGGAWNMRRLQRRRYAIIAAALACIPFVSPLIYYGISFGIWALVMLLRPKIRAAFTS